jgi:NitT/TauT family transport system permease protein
MRFVTFYTPERRKGKDRISDADFSYSSLTSIPRELREAASIYGFGGWQHFLELELPYGTIGLVWNSIVSVASGWFFLMAYEMLVLGNRDFRLPGLGSFLQNAASECATGLGAQITQASETGNFSVLLLSTIVMAALVVCINRAVWRPMYHLAETRYRLE